MSYGVTTKECILMHCWYKYMHCQRKKSIGLKGVVNIGLLGEALLHRSLKLYNVHIKEENNGGL